MLFVILPGHRLRYLTGGERHRDRQGRVDSWCGYGEERSDCLGQPRHKRRIHQPVAGGVLVIAVLTL